MLNLPKFFKSFGNIISFLCSNKYHIITSFKIIIGEIFKINFFFYFKKRKNGISVLLPTQNEEKIVELSIRSFLDFADEIIVVDNGSIDNTIEIIKKLEKKYPKVKFYNKPELGDLYQNRNFALKQSKYRWICRFDSDYVAYTSGKYNIKKLRNFLLCIPREIIPKIIYLYRINIAGDFYHSRKRDFVGNNNNFSILMGPEPRIYEYFPFFAFGRFGRREYGVFQNILRKIVYKRIHLMHCDIKSPLNFFLRSERTNWREVGNYKKYPTLLSYMKAIIYEKYSTKNFREALEIFAKKEILNEKNYIEYDPEKYQPYPKLIKDEIKKENDLQIGNLFSDE